MLKTIKFLAIATMAAMGVSSASAIQFVNTHNVLLLEGQSASGTFDISPPYDPASQTLLSATATFYFQDDSYVDSLEYAIVQVETAFFGLTQVGNQTILNPFNIYGSISGAVWGTGLWALSSTGELDYKVTAWDDGNPWTQRDFIFKKAVLDVEIGSNVSVPDGGMSLAMLGLGLLGMAAFRRRA